MHICFKDAFTEERWTDNVIVYAFTPNIHFWTVAFVLHQTLRVSHLEIRTLFLLTMLLL